MLRKAKSNQMFQIKNVLVRTFQITLLLSCFYIFFTYTSNRTEESNHVHFKIHKTLRQTENKKQITILLMKWFGNTDIWGLKEANVVCSKRCTFTNDLSKWNESSVVAFHGNNFALLDNFSTKMKRPFQEQIWVWINLEPPTLYGLKASHKSEMTFDWTMTYRKDSDICTPYSRIYHLNAIPPGMNNIKNEYFKGYTPPELPPLDGFEKRGMAAWVVSHCKTSSQREALVAELQKYIPVDIYGSCGDHKCSVPREKSGKGSECHAEISQKYKFYLAFENSLCTDYVTEKFYDILTLEMIPVVYGAADYSSILPFDSYINVLDFPSLSYLANHMNHLSQNPAAWLKYFKWRKYYWILTSTFLPSMCDLCDKFVSEIESGNGSLVHKSYNNIHHWWLNDPESNQSSCKAELEVRNIIQNLSLVSHP